jgi:hypothetical protein
MPNSVIHRSLRNPIFLLALFAGILACVVQSGELGTADTTYRLQSTHAFWTSDPPVTQQDYDGGFGVHGRGGSLQSWYGIGQSLLMLPADILGTGIENLHIFDNYRGNDPAVRSIVVTCLTNSLLSVLTALVCFRFLTLLNFAIKQAIAGVLALLLLTTHLHYTQNMMENNYIFLLTLIGFCYQYSWLRTGSRRHLLIGSAAFGLNLLTRLTTGMDLLAGGLFVFLVLILEGLRGCALWKRCLSYIAIAFPVYAFFGFLDRLYQFYRFGSFFNTYVGLVRLEVLAKHPDWPKSYPFETPFRTGFYGALFAPEKSIFLFDPLLILSILLIIIAWKRFSPAIKAFTITGYLLLAAYICFYARYTVWSGDDAWGDRYVSSIVELVAMLAVPLLMRHRHALPKLIWIGGIVLCAASAIIQAASLAFWLPLELYQIDNFGHPQFTIGLRFRNIVAFALGKMNAWGLDTPAMKEDEWDYIHITTWNFLPFVLRRVGQAPAWAVNLTLTLWITALAALTGIFLRLRQVLRSSPSATADKSVS